MKITIVAGSHRRESESGRVARYIEAVLQRIGADRTYVLSRSGNPLPLWDEGVWEDDPRWAAVCKPIAAELASSDGFVIVAPEWSGMVPAGLKNFFLLCSGNLLADEHDASVRARIEYSLGVLLQDAKALGAVRERDAIDLKRVPHGM